MQPTHPDPDLPKTHKRAQKDSHGVALDVRRHGHGHTDTDIQRHGCPHACRHAGTHRNRGKSTHNTRHTTTHTHTTTHGHNAHTHADLQARTRAHTHPRTHNQHAHPQPTCAPEVRTRAARSRPLCCVRRRAVATARGTKCGTWQSTACTNLWDNKGYGYQ